MKAKNTKLRLIILAVAAAGLLGWAAYAKFTQPKQASNTGIPATSTTDEPQPSTDPNAGKPTEEAPKKEDAAQPSTPASTEQSANSSLSVTISRAGQIDQALQIRAIIQGAKTGTCNAKLTGPGTTVEASHAIEFQQTGYTCGAFDIPVSQFNASGQWQLSLTVTSGSSTSSPATQTITITK